MSIKVLHCFPSGSDAAPGLRVQGRQVRLAAVAADGAGQADLQLLIQAGGQPSSALAAAAKYGCVEAVRTLVAAGANIIGGCCGTSPAHITAMAKAARSLAVKA